MGRYASPEEAYWAFFETFNRKDAEAGAAVMNYPNVRVAPVDGGGGWKIAARSGATVG